MMSLPLFLLRLLCLLLFDIFSHYRQREDALTLLSYLHSLPLRRRLIALGDIRHELDTPERLLPDGESRAPTYEAMIFAMA